MRYKLQLDSLDHGYVLHPDEQTWSVSSQHVGQRSAGTMCERSGLQRGIESRPDTLFIGRSARRQLRRQLPDLLGPHRATTLRLLLLGNVAGRPALFQTGGRQTRHAGVRPVVLEPILPGHLHDAARRPREPGTQVGDPHHHTQSVGSHMRNIPLGLGRLQLQVDTAQTVAAGRLHQSIEWS